jgi:hypothetical protein
MPIPIFRWYRKRGQRPPNNHECGVTAPALPLCAPGGERLRWRAYDSAVYRQQGPRPLHGIQYEFDLVRCCANIWGHPVRSKGCGGPAPSPSVITSKPAIHDHFKTGQRNSYSGQDLLYLTSHRSGKYFSGSKPAWPAGGSRKGDFSGAV